MKNGSPSLPRAPSLPSQNFCSGRCKATFTGRTPPPLTSPDRMPKKCMLTCRQARLLRWHFLCWGEYFLRGKEGNRFEKRFSLSPSRSLSPFPKLFSGRCKATFTGRTPPPLTSPDRMPKKCMLTCRQARLLRWHFLCWGEYFLRGKEGNRFEKRFSLSPSRSLSPFPKLFSGRCKATFTGRTPPPLTSPDRMPKKCMLTCSEFGWLEVGRRPRDATFGVWTNKVFGGMGGLGGRAPLFTKGPFPPRKKKNPPLQKNGNRFARAKGFPVWRRWRRDI